MSETTRDAYRDRSIRCGTYDHLNREHSCRVRIEREGVTLAIGVDELASAIAQANYGTIRMLAAIARESRKKTLERDPRPAPCVADRIEAVLDEGWYA